MRKLLLILVISISNLVFANDNLLGYWSDLKKGNEYSVVIKFEKDDDGEYYGTICKLKDPIYLDGEYKGMEKMDLFNKNEKLKKRKLIGIKMIQKFKYSEKYNDYRNGIVYNPEDGNMYYAYIKLLDKKMLKIRGSIDPLSIFGKSDIWVKIGD